MRSPLALALGTAALLACGGSPDKPAASLPPPPTTASPTAASASASASSAPAEPASADVATTDTMRAAARTRVKMIAQDFVAGWEREQMAPNGKTTMHVVCPSARPLPAVLDRTKAVSLGDDPWMKDPGWNCLRFLPSEAHWFQYELRVTDELHAKAFARRHDVEIVVEITRADAKATEWTIGQPSEKKP